MHSRLYVVCITNPFETKPYYLCKQGKDVFVKRDLPEIISYGEIVAYGLENSIDGLRMAENYLIPPIIDMQTAKKLLVGQPKTKYLIGKEPWTLRNILGSNGTSSATLRWLNDIDRLRTINPDTSPDFDVRLNDLLSEFEKAWHEIVTQLIENGEQQRFFEIETPIYNFFLRSEIDGIDLSHDNLQKRLLDLKTMYYSAIKRLEFEYGFLSQKIKLNMSWKDIKDYCTLQDIGDEIDNEFWQYVEIYAEDDEFLRLLFVANNSYKDYSALLKYCVSDYKKVYPQFDVMGTVTGRILIKRPGIQYLKKTSRDIFSPADGNVFLYADFDQFEPGIIASFSKDKKLIDLYNKGDIYEGLSDLLFGTVEKRKTAKIIFLSFIYGMSQERLGKLILETTGQDEMKNRGLLFFLEFDVLAKWKQEVCNEAKECGYASSRVGNRRYLAQKGQITAKERRWVPSQIIQGTASYIFKKSLIELKREVPNTQFLVPMHDAILLKTPKDMEGKVKRAVKNVFNGTFKDVCPDIEPSVSFEKFSE